MWKMKLAVRKVNFYRLNLSANQGRMPEEIAKCCIFYAFVIQYLLTTNRKSCQVNVNTYYFTVYVLQHISVLTELSPRRNFKRRDAFKMWPTSTKCHNNLQLIWCVICKTSGNVYTSIDLRCFTLLKIVISLMMGQ